VRRGSTADTRASDARLEAATRIFCRHRRAICWSRHPLTFTVQLLAHTRGLHVATVLTLDYVDLIRRTCGVPWLRAASLGPGVYGWVFGLLKRRP